MNLVKRVFTERRAVLIPLTILLVGNLIVLAAVVWPLQRSVAGAQDAQYQATKSVADARALEAEAKADRDSKDRADIELRKFYSEVLPKDDRTAISVATFSLSRLADAAHVTFKVGQWDREAVRDSRLSRVTGQVTLIGEYANIRKFLYEVETAQEFVIVDSVELGTASAVQSDSLLELGLSVSTYFLTDTRLAGVTK
jgi:Tfp pilus assembly protein PilO